MWTIIEMLRPLAMKDLNACKIEIRCPIFAELLVKVLIYGFLLMRNDALLHLSDAHSPRKPWCPNE